MAELAYLELYAISPSEARRRLVRDYQRLGSVRGTARIWHTSPGVVRRWVRRWQENPDTDFSDRSRRPKHCPRQTPEPVAAMVLDLWRKTEYGRRRLALEMQARGVPLSEGTIRHILRRAGNKRVKRPRKIVYPAAWAWEQGEPFALIQTDTKDVRDKGSLGTALVRHLDLKHLPRYQWTACDGVTRIRFLAYSHHLNSTHGIAFMLLVLLWLRAHGIETPVSFQTDWGQEFGGDDARKVIRLSRQFLEPLEGHLTRYPMGRKGYNGRVERSHRTDDEELYRPILLTLEDSEQYLKMATRWLLFYNLRRRHTGVGMDGRTPFQVLRDKGYQGPERIAMLPPILLDNISADLLLACDREVGTDLLTQYTAHGRLSGDTWTKTARASVHQLRAPRAWCVDLVDLDAAESNGARVCAIRDLETGRTFWATLATIHRLGFRLARGHGEQVALTLEHWSPTRGEAEEETGREPERETLAVRQGNLW